MKIEMMLLFGVLLLGLASAFVFADSNSGENEASNDGGATATPSVAAVSAIAGVRNRFKVCTMEFEPYACPDGKQYPNKCFARNDGWDPEKDCEKVGVGGILENVKEKVKERIEANKRIAEEYLKHIKENLTGDARYHRCRQFDNSTQRESCFQTETGIGELAREKIKCQSEDNVSQCVQKLKDGLQSAWNFRFQNIIDNAEALEKKGVSNDTISAFTAFVQAQALAFENATAPERKEIAKNVSDAWKEFRKNALQDILDAEIANSTSKLENALDVLKQVREKLQAKNLTTAGLDNAISRLEENIGRINSGNATFRQKWLLSHEAIARLKHAKKALVRAANGLEVEEFENPETSVPKEVEEADEEDG
ncbi:MAG: hypothetical protein V1717_03560 [Candidatus Micrarchaeota archaeon]